MFNNFELSIVKINPPFCDSVNSSVQPFNQVYLSLKYTRNVPVVKTLQLRDVTFVFSGSTSGLQNSSGQFDMSRITLSFLLFFYIFDG